MEHLHYIDLISTNTPRPLVPTHNFHCPSPTSYSDTAGWKHYVFSSFNKMPVHSSRGFHVSPNTERLGQKKSPPERNPICVLIHSAGLDMSKQLAFTTPATPFHFKLADHLNVRTHWIEGSWMAVPAPSSWIERDKRFRSRTGSETSWLIVALAEKSSERGLEILTEGNPIYRNSWPRYFAKQHVWMARFSDGTMVVYLMFAYGNHFPDTKTWLISKKRFKPL